MAKVISNQRSVISKQEKPAAVEVPALDFLNKPESIGFEGQPFPFGRFAIERAGEIAISDRILTDY